MNVDPAARFAELQHRFRLGLEKRLANAAILIQCDSGPKPLMILFHTIVGTGGTYGYDAIAEIGRECELLCRTAVETDRMFTQAERSKLNEGIESLRQYAIPSSSSPK